ncbi:type III secretion HpaP family protein [Roseiconus lacunae]|uniref:type III secretion HpaP family protein n=1 Tax=Roseiconus lacunae TaxID=2605694 RepID=UPI001E5DF7F1|nr:type III secretion HpaP family protein [Roseiconus lacunae]MCD0457871.1 hypothetical protein [Roseiconus lacunae]
MIPKQPHLFVGEAGTQVNLQMPAKLRVPTDVDPEQGSEEFQSILQESDDIECLVGRQSSANETSASSEEPNPVDDLESRTDFDASHARSVKEQESDSQPGCSEPTADQSTCEIQLESAEHLVSRQVDANSSPSPMPEKSDRRSTTRSSLNLESDHQPIETTHAAELKPLDGEFNVPPNVSNPSRQSILPDPTPKSYSAGDGHFAAPVAVPTVAPPVVLGARPPERVTEVPVANPEIGVLVSGPEMTRPQAKTTLSDLSKQQPAEIPAASKVHSDASGKGQADNSSSESQWNQVPILGEQILTGLFNQSPDRVESMTSEMIALVERVSEQILVSSESLSRGGVALVRISEQVLAGTEVEIRQVNEVLQVRFLFENSSSAELVARYQSAIQSELSESLGQAVEVDVSADQQDGRSRQEYLPVEDDEP